jgi:hypothetical protein
MNSSAQSFSQLIAAGAFLPVQISGAEFYFTVLTAPVFCRASPGGNFCQFVQGQGLVGNFTSLELQNPNAFPVVFQVFCTPSGFVDRRTIPDVQTKNVIVPAVFSVVTAGVELWSRILDKSGQTITDMNGQSWTAVNRLSVSLQTMPFTGAIAGPSLGVFKDASTFPASFYDALMIIQSYNETDNQMQPPTVLSISGNFSVALLLGGMITTAASVFEIYSALAPGFAGQPPS